MQLVDLFNGLNIPPSIFACGGAEQLGRVRDLVEGEIADDHRRDDGAEAAGGEINAETVNSDA